MDANVDDGQCDFSCLLTGCTDATAVNYDAAATTDDGSCLFVGCTDPDGLDYDPTANYPGGCDYPKLAQVTSPVTAKWTSTTCLTSSSSGATSVTKTYA